MHNYINTHDFALRSKPPQPIGLLKQSPSSANHLLHPRNFSLSVIISRALGPMREWPVGARFLQELEQGRDLQFVLYACLWMGFWGVL